ncbi:MAG: IS3 family transposase [Parcubacteria group bacterium]
MKQSDRQRRELVESHNPNIPITRQCQLLGISRSSCYYQPQPVKLEELALMNRIDEIYTEQPYYGVPRITAQLNREEWKPINHKRVERLMRIMGIQAIFPRRNTSQPNIQHSVYPYLLNTININCPNKAWGTDITYVRANGIWFYLVAILDWFSRYVVSFKLSSSLSVDFCTQALNSALNTAIPDYHNSDQGSQFTSNDYLSILQRHPEIKISMDGKGRCFDNIFTERLWRTVKYEEVYLKDYQSFTEAEQSLTQYFHTYNHKRLHQSLNYQIPAEVYFSTQ